MQAVTRTDPLTLAVDRLVPAPQVSIEEMEGCGVALRETLYDQAVSQGIQTSLEAALSAARRGPKSLGASAARLGQVVAGVTGATVNTYRHEPDCPSLPSLTRFATRAVLDVQPWATLTVPEEDHRSSYGGVNTLGASPYSDGMFAESRGIDTRSSSVQYGICATGAPMPTTPDVPCTATPQPAVQCVSRFTAFGMSLWQRHGQSRLAEMQRAGYVYYLYKEGRICFGPEANIQPQSLLGAVTAYTQTQEFLRIHYEEIATTRQQIGQALATELSLIKGDTALQHDCQIRDALEAIWEMWVAHGRRGTLLNESLLECHPLLWDVPEIIRTAPNRMWSFKI
jgi:hypothetical protein